MQRASVGVSVKKERKSKNYVQRRTVRNGFFFFLLKDGIVGGADMPRCSQHVRLGLLSYLGQVPPATGKDLADFQRRVVVAIAVRCFPSFLFAVFVLRFHLR